jgi:hypothetical protein
MKRAAQFDQEVAEKKRRFDSGEQLVRVKDQSDVESSTVERASVASSSKRDGKRQSAKDQNPFAAPWEEVFPVGSAAEDQNPFAVTANNPELLDKSLNDDKANPFDDLP